MLQLLLKPTWANKIKQGYPWVYKDALLSPPLPTKPGDLVQLMDGKHPIALAYYNPLTKLCARVLTLDPQLKIDESFFLQQLKKALAFREKWSKEHPFYRLVHAEADGLPGLIVDRFGDTLVCQANTAGMERLKPLWLKALNTLFSPTRVILREDTASRLKEGLPLSVKAALGTLEEWLPVKENNLTFFADPTHGQKTGWFYDQRTNRYWLSSRVKNKTVLDLYAYSGGFGVLMAAQGAQQVTLVDGSEQALTLGQKAAEFNGVSSQCEFIKADVFDLLPDLIEKKHHFDVVIADPPAFVKQAYYKNSGLKGYQKLAKLTSQVVAPKGLLFIASCSHHASSAEFRQAVEEGIKKSHRNATLLRKGGADRDHPIHPLLPETHYLKSLVYKID